MARLGGDDRADIAFYGGEDLGRIADIKIDGALGG
ncbi:uncharacterized protein METZ01_LOCUS468833 [marine metagenome]|uniref:Uncharacterized protein n=1 Tax=marine metagenome TaxID=408172 RepID=A0A383B8A2_9ZZZZ